jgi:hypothetical protein
MGVFLHFFDKNTAISLKITLHPPLLCHSHLKTPISRLNTPQNHPKTY